MVARINTVAFQGIEVKPVDVQVQLSNGLPAFNIVGLPDKAVAESKETMHLKSEMTYRTGDSRLPLLSLI